MSAYDVVSVLMLAASLVVALARNPDLLVWCAELPGRTVAGARRRLRRWAR